MAVPGWAVRTRQGLRPRRGVESGPRRGARVRVGVGVRVARVVLRRRGDLPA